MPAVIPVIMAGMAIAGKVAENRAKGRAAETQLNTERDQLAAQTYRTQQEAADRQRQQALEERKYAGQSRNQAMSQLMRGQLMQSYMPQPLSIPGITSAGGGAAGDRGFEAQRESGGQIVQSALARLMQGEQFDPQTLLTAPTQTPLPQGGKLDKWLGILGTAGSIGQAAYGAGGYGKPKVTMPGGLN